MVADCIHLYFTHAYMLLEMNAALGVKYLPVEARRMQPSSGSDSPLTTESVKHKYLQTCLSIAVYTIEYLVRIN